MEDIAQQVMKSVAEQDRQQDEDCFELDEWYIPRKAIKEAWLRGCEYATKRRTTNK